MEGAPDESTAEAPIHHGSAVRIAAGTDAMHGDGVLGLIEQHAVVADAKPMQSLELTAEWFDVAFAGLGVTMQRLKDMQSGSALNRADLRPNVGTKADRLHWATDRPCSFGPAPL